MASLVRPFYVKVIAGKRVRKRCRIWYAQLRVDGKVKRVSLKTTNKSAAQLKLADLVRQGSVPTVRPLADHLADWRAAMVARGVSAPQIRLQLFRVNRIAAACHWVRLDQLDSGAAEIAMRQLQLDGLAAKTRNDYADGLRAFGRWLSTGRAKRLPDNPFSDLADVTTTTDRRHDRRALTNDEMGKLLAATETGPQWRSLSGPDRSMLYRLAISTGFRVGELAELTPALFRLDDEIPVVLLPARHDKARRVVRQPLPASIVPLLRDYLRDRQSSSTVWPGTWPQDGAEMMKADLERAGIPYVVQGPDGPLYADMHSLRHYFCAQLDRPGVTLKEAMELARHSDPRLTAKIYGRPQLERLSAAVNLACTNLARPGRQGPEESGSGG